MSCFEHLSCQIIKLSHICKSNAMCRFFFVWNHIRLCEVLSYMLKVEYFTKQFFRFCFNRRHFTGYFLLFLFQIL